jgi:uncharacterized UBP type Zn finger protein
MPLYDDTYIFGVYVCLHCGHKEKCTCGRIKIGSEVTGHLNWNPDCPVHPWDDKLQAQNDRAVEAQRQAAHARHVHRGESFRHGCHVCVPDGSGP